MTTQLFFAIARKEFLHLFCKFLFIWSFWSSVILRYCRSYSTKLFSIKFNNSYKINKKFIFNDLKLIIFISKYRNKVIRDTYSNAYHLLIYFSYSSSWSYSNQTIIPLFILAKKIKYIFEKKSKQISLSSYIYYNIDLYFYYI